MTFGLKPLTVKPVAVLATPRPTLHLRRSLRQKTPQIRKFVNRRIFSSELDAEVVTVEPSDIDESYVPVFTREQLPKGERREVVVDGKQIVVFWYRSEVFACESRSPAEGAFSTGFIQANFTEDYGIICPGTDTIFSLKTGEIIDWFPTNFVLRSIIPKDTCRPLEVYPVKITKDKIFVSFKGATWEE